MNTPLTKHEALPPDLAALMRLAETNTDKLRSLVAQLGGDTTGMHDYNGHVPQIPEPYSQRTAEAFALLESLGYSWCPACGWTQEGCTHD